MGTGQGKLIGINALNRGARDAMHGMQAFFRARVVQNPK